MANPVAFIEQVRNEIGRITWPTRREVITTTIMVLVLAAITAVFFSVVDLVIRTGLGFVINAVGS